MRKRGHNEGSIQKAGKRYRVFITVGYDADGKQVRKSHTADSYVEAREKLAEFQQLYRLSPYYDENVTLTQWGEKVLEVFVKPRVRPKTYEQYYSVFKNYIKTSALGRMRLGKIAPVNIQELVNANCNKPRTALYIKQTLSVILNQALDDGIIVKSPLRKIKVPAQAPQRIVDFDEAKLSDLLKALKVKPVLYLGARILLYTGLRRSEVTALLWRDIDFTNRTLTVNKASGAGGKKAATKSEASNRTLPLPAALIKDLKEYRQSIKVVYQSVLTYRGDAYTPAGFARAIAKTVGHPVKIHDFRHIYATTLLRNGANIRTLQQLLGHSDIRLTLQTYAHVLDEDKHKAAGILDEALKGLDYDGDVVKEGRIKYDAGQENSYISDGRRQG